MVTAEGRWRFGNPNVGYGGSNRWLRMSRTPANKILIALSASVLSIGLDVSLGMAQAVKPQISELPDSSIPRGCGYSLDDWKGTTLAWAPYQYEGNTQPNNLLMSIDGEVRELPINSRSENHISAYDGRYYVDIRTPRWKRVGSELSQARATLLLRNTKAYIEANIVVRASQGC